MKIKLPLLIVSLFAAALLWGQQKLDAKGQQELAQRKIKAKENGTVFWAYDTIYKYGEPYCLMKSRDISDDGNEYVVRSLKNEELVYIKEPGEFKKAIGELTGEANIEFSFLKETQKLYVPQKSVNTLQGFIVEQDLINGDAANMKAVKKLLFVYNMQNPQGYTGPAILATREDSIAMVNKIRQEDSLQAMRAAEEAMKAEQKPATDTAKYAMVERNRKAAITIKDYMITQDGKLIGRYDSHTQADGADSKTIYEFKLPNWTLLATATNDGLGTFTWDIVIQPYGKHETLKTSISPKKTLKELVEFLVNNNYL